MRRGLGVALAVWASVGLAACTGDQRTTSPASPSSLPVTADAFVGEWSSSTAGNGSALAACSRFDYTVDKVSERAVNLKVTATCASVDLDATGSGSLVANVLGWSAQGTATSVSGAECSFLFSDSTATPLVDGSIRIDYKGKVCGVPVNGSEVVRKK
jgi:hypothetical protein